MGEVGGKGGEAVWEAQHNFKDLALAIQCCLCELPKISKQWVEMLSPTYGEDGWQPMKDPIVETVLWCPGHTEVQGKSFCYFLVSPCRVYLPSSGPHLLCYHGCCPLLPLETASSVFQHESSSLQFCIGPAEASVSSTETLPGSQPL